MRFSVLACVRLSRNAQFNHPPESLHPPETAITPFLNRIAALPDDLIRDFVISFVGIGFEFRDAEIESVKEEISSKQRWIKRKEENVIKEVKELKTDIAELEVKLSRLNSGLKNW